MAAKANSTNEVEFPLSVLLLARFCPFRAALSLRLDPHLSEEVTAGSSLSTTWRCFEKALDDFMKAELVAA